MALRLTLAFSDNPRVQPLKDGTVKPQNIDLECITLGPSGLFQRNLFYDDFDVSEMSMSGRLLALERRNGSKWDWSALPVFLSRGHVWPTLYVNAASGIASLGDLKGKRIGVPDYDMTAALWFRITLKDLCGIEAKDNVWYNGRTKELSHGGALGLDKDGPVGVTHPWVALELFNTFRRSKEIAYERARRAQSAYLYFPGKDFQEQAAVLGEDPYPIGLRAMGKNVERAIQGSLEQGLLRKPLRLEDVYYRTTLHT